ncbi:MAG: S4 domain-containing protein [Thiohalomonadaceae bacterium]
MSDKVRLDKWLWAARFYKTRALASDAINAGHVDVDGARAKPARPMKPDDEITIRKGTQVFVVRVRALSERRGPASEAQLLYEETAESRRRREEAAEQHRLGALLAPAPERRPDKRDRRRLMRFTRDGG